MATLDDGYQSNPRLTYFQRLVKDGAGVAFNGCLFSCRSSTVRPKLLPLHSFPSLCHKGSGQYFVSSFHHYVGELTDQRVFKHRVGLRCWAAFISWVFLSSHLDFSVSSAKDLQWQPLSVWRSLCQDLALCFTGLALEAAGLHPTHATLGLTTLHTASTLAALEVPERVTGDQEKDSQRPKSEHRVSNLGIKSLSLQGPKGAPFHYLS